MSSIWLGQGWGEARGDGGVGVREWWGKGVTLNKWSPTTCLSLVTWPSTDCLNQINTLLSFLISHTNKNTPLPQTFTSYFHKERGHRREVLDSKANKIPSKKLGGVDLRGGWGLEMERLKNWDRGWGRYSGGIFQALPLRYVMGNWLTLVFCCMCHNICSLSLLCALIVG